MLMQTNAEHVFGGSDEEKYGAYRVVHGERRQRT